MATMRRRPVRPVYVEPLCDVCGEPLKWATGFVYASSPPQRDFTCANGHTERLYEQDWPRMTYEPVDPDAGEDTP